MAERYLRSARLLAQCFQSFERCSNLMLRQRTGLTPAQFDIVATLGNTAGMTFKELGERTLITKGTLTGVVDRLEARGLVRREVLPDDRRCVRVVLSAAGQQMFDRVFGPQIAFLKQAFVDYSEDEFEQLDRQLTRLRDRLERFRLQAGARAADA